MAKRQRGKADSRRRQGAGQGGASGTRAAKRRPKVSSGAPASPTHAKQAGGVATAAPSLGPAVAIGEPAAAVAIGEPAAAVAIGEPAAAASAKAPAVAPVPASAAPVVAAPRWSLALEVSPAKLVLVRVALFALVAIDAVLALAHAPRYGAGGFNVAHLAWLSELGPTRASYALAQAAISALAVILAIGAGGRALSLTLWALYGWCLFGSQLDSYQHHYLIWWVLLLWSLSPGVAPPPQAPIRSVALRLITVQLAVMYLWAAISKLDPLWIDGSTLARQLGGTLRHWIDATVGIAVAARLVIVVELVLAATVWRVRTWRWAVPLGVGLHLAIAFSGLEIGLFAYVMLALYLLLLPEAWIEAGSEAWLGARRHAWLAPAGSLVRRLRLLAASRWAAGLLLVAAAALTLALRSPLPPALALALLAWAAWRLVRGTSRAAVAAFAVLSLWVAVDRLAHVAVDYHRFWGGTARRLGDEAQAEQAYRALVRLEPGLESAHFQLGRLLVRRGALEEGLAALRRAEALAPESTRALVEQARALTAAGRHQEAAELARRAQRQEAGRPAPVEDSEP